MRTNIVIDDDLLAEALEATGAKSKREVVELGLAMLVKLSRQERVKEFRGKLRWQGDLDTMRDSVIRLCV
ncbi:MAG: type II toxin-antitoxin system VapB family antitoxin [bacterium]